MSVVTLTYPLHPGEAELIAWSVALADRDASVSRQPERGVNVTVWIDGVDVVEAVPAARRVAASVIDADPIGVSSLDDDEYERMADAPTLPRLLSAPDVADVLGVSRQRVHQLRTMAAFPAPVVELRTGPIWDARAIDRFDRDWKRKPGRPAAS